MLFCWDLSAGLRVHPHPGSRENHEGAVSVRLFIGNLPYSANEADLREHLSSVGEPAQVVLPTDRETGRPRGFAFVDYTDRAVAEEAIRRFNLQPFKGRPLAVSEARPREERPPVRRVPEVSRARDPLVQAASRRGRRVRAASPRARRKAAVGGPRSKNFGPDAPPKNKRKPPRKDSDCGPKGRSRSVPWAVSTTPTRIGAEKAPRSRSKSRSTMWRPRRKRTTRTPTQTDRSVQA